MIEILFREKRDFLFRTILKYNEYDFYHINSCIVLVLVLVLVSWYINNQILCIMKKLLFVAALGVAGLASAKAPANDFVKVNGETECIIQEAVTTSCLVYESKCGEVGFFCKEEIIYEEYVEFGYLVEDAFCGGCNFGC